MTGKARSIFLFLALVVLLVYVLGSFHVSAGFCDDHMIVVFRPVSSFALDIFGGC